MARVPVLLSICLEVVGSGMALRHHSAGTLDWRAGYFLRPEILSLDHGDAGKDVRLGMFHDEVFIPCPLVLSILHTRGKSHLHVGYHQ
jgi:hypothetical protein